MHIATTCHCCVKGVSQPACTLIKFLRTATSAGQDMPPFHATNLENLTSRKDASPAHTHRVTKNRLA